MKYGKKMIREPVKGGRGGRPEEMDIIIFHYMTI